jgi:hypothetical protein
MSSGQTTPCQPLDVSKVPTTATGAPVDMASIAGPGRQTPACAEHLDLDPSAGQVAIGEQPRSACCRRAPT